MRRVYRNFHIALISAMLLAVIAVEAVADYPDDSQPGRPQGAGFAGNFL